MVINIQIILYYSSSDLPRLLKSIQILEVGNQSVCFHLVDQSENEEEYDKVLKQYNEIKQIQNISIDLTKQKNYGFGKGHNEIYRKNKDTYKDFFVILNPDSILHSDLTTNILIYLNQLEHLNWGLLELQQFPSESPKYYNPVTLETNWASGAGLIVRLEPFETIGMFDENIFMYGEDVDLSIRMRMNKYKILTLPNAKFTHLTKDTDVSKESKFARVNKQAAELYLRYKFAKDKDVEKYASFINANDPDRKDILSEFERMKNKLNKRTYYKNFVDKNQDYTNIRWTL